MQDILNRSVKATCGISEKQITVAKKNVDKTIARLRNAGFYVIGKSLDKDPTKIWFIRRGGL